MGLRQKGLLELFSHQVSAQPEFTALNIEDQSLSYAALDRRSDQLACRLHKAGVRRGDNVVVLASRCVETVISFLATLKTGAHYVPLDLDHFSHDRVRDTISFVKPKAILGAPVKGNQCYEIISWAEPWPMLANEQEHFSALEINLDDLAYIVFTSGTTSAPKGVMISHRAIANYVQQGSVDAPFNMNVKPADLVALVFSPAFDGGFALIRYGLY